MLRGRLSTLLESTGSTWGLIFAKQITASEKWLGKISKFRFIVSHLAYVFTYLPTKGGKGLIKIFIVVVAPLLHLSHFKDTQMYHQDVLAKKCSHTSSKIVN